jgi:hypothetical protein
MPRKTRHLIPKHLTSKLQVSPNFTLDSVADSNYRGKCDVGSFLIFERSLCVVLGQDAYLHFQRKVGRFHLRKVVPTRHQ